jgi:hypothetical protein
MQTQQGNTGNACNRYSETNFRNACNSRNERNGEMEAEAAMNVKAMPGPGPKNTRASATCPFCGAPTWLIILSTEAQRRHSCLHFAAIIQHGDDVEVEFERQAA